MSTTSSSKEHCVKSAASAAAATQLPIRESNHKIIYRGIANTNGTGCHTSSALQLLFHCFPRLRDELLNLANISANYTVQSSSPEHKHAQAIEKEFVYQLSWFFYLLANAEDIIAIAQAATSSSSAGSVHGSPNTKQKKSTRKKSRRSSRSKKIDEQKAAAIDAFVTKSRKGKTNMLEWRNLVDAMKKHNRTNFDQALGQVLNRRNSEEEGSNTGKHKVEEVQYGGSLGGGRKSASCELTTSTTLENAGDTINPTKFYEQLMSYTIDAMETRYHINTNNVGDAAVVFRCLIAALEFSISRELTRLDEMIGLFEIENWNGETKEEDDETTLQTGQRNAYELQSSLSKARTAMEYEWKGSLLSRIVGTSQTGAVSSDNIITTTSITRTKKNGNIERPIPIPWQLPVLAQNNNDNNKADMEKKDATVDESTTRCYFESLASSLHSVTICPNPIRGYNWNGLVKSGDVNEETIITKMDENGNILIDKGEETRYSSEEIDAARSKAPLIITESKDEEEKKSAEVISSPARRVHSDDVSVISTTLSVASVSSRTIGTQTDRDGDVEVKTIIVRTSAAETEIETQDRAVGVDTDAGTGADNTTETSSDRDASSQSNASNFVIKKDACYAAAVAALATAKKKGRSPRSANSRKRLDNFRKESTTTPPSKNERDICYAAAVGALVRAPSRDLALDDIDVVFSVSLSNNSDGDSSFGDNYSNEFSVESKVPSVDNAYDSERLTALHHSDRVTALSYAPSGGDASSETHSSAIDTPSDIDDISLGSWTDSEAGDEEKKNENEPLIRNISPVVRAQESNDADADADANAAEGVSFSVQDKTETNSNVVPKEVAHSVCSNSYSAVSDSIDDSASSNDDDSSASSSSSSSSSSTGSDSTSSTDSSSTSSSGSSSSDRDVAIIGVTESDEKSNAYSNSIKMQEWTTRKETRFCQPLPRSLIFHLKRFAFTPSGHGEKLPGALDIPEELNLRSCCLEQQQQISGDESNDEQYCYQLTGALVHVDPVLDKDEQDQLEHGAMSEGHYVTFICKPTEEKNNKQDMKTWIELDDEFVRVLGSQDSCDTSSTDTALNVLSGCDVSKNEETCGTSTSSKRVVKGQERRYATLVVYSRKC